MIGYGLAKRISFAGLFYGKEMEVSGAINRGRKEPGVRALGSLGRDDTRTPFRACGVWDETGPSVMAPPLPRTRLCDKVAFSHGEGMDTGRDGRGISYYS